MNLKVIDNGTPTFDFLDYENEICSGRKRTGLFYENLVKRTLIHKHILKLVKKKT